MPTMADHVRREIAVAGNRASITIINKVIRDDAIRQGPLDVEGILMAIENIVFHQRRRVGTLKINAIARVSRMQGGVVKTAVPDNRVERA